MDVTCTRLNVAREYVGSNPRHGFEASIGSDFFNAQVLLIKDAVHQSTNIIQLVYDKGGKYSQWYHLFQISSRHDHRWFANCHFEPVSNWSFQKLLERFEKEQDDAIRVLYNRIRKEPKLAILMRGLTWERQCHIFFQSLKFPRSFVLRSLDDPSISITWDYPGPTKYESFEPRSFSSQLQALIQDKTPAYLKPMLTIFSTLDSLVYQPGILDILQMTVRVEHPSSTAGFGLIQKWLRVKSPASHLRPSKDRPWKFIFVVPEEMAASFEQVSFGGVWDSKVKQYVLGLSDDDVGLGVPG